MAGSRSVLFRQWLPVFELQWHCRSRFPRPDNYDLGFFCRCSFVKSDISGMCVDNMSCGLCATLFIGLFRVSYHIVTYWWSYSSQGKLHHMDTTCVRRCIRAHDCVSTQLSQNSLLRRTVTTLPSSLGYLRTELTSARDLRATRFLTTIFYIHCI